MGIDDVLRHMFGSGGSGSPLDGFGAGGEAGAWSHSRSRGQQGPSEAARRQLILRCMGEEYVKATKLYRNTDKPRSGTGLEIKKEIPVSLEDLHLGVKKRFRVKDFLTLRHERSRLPLKPHPWRSF